MRRRRRRVSINERQDAVRLAAEVDRPVDPPPSDDEQIGPPAEAKPADPKKKDSHMHNRTCDLSEQVRNWARRAAGGDVAGHARELHALLSPGLPGAWTSHAQVNVGDLNSWHDPLAGLSVELRREARALSALAGEVAASECPQSEIGDLLAACKTFMASLEAAEGQVSALLTKRQVAELLSVSQRQVDYLRESGRLQAVKVGQAVRFQQADLQQFINEAVSS